MNELYSSQEHDTPATAEHAQKLHAAIELDRGDQNISERLFTNVDAWKKELPNGESVDVALYPQDRGFRDKNYRNPTDRILSSITAADGREYTIWHTAGTEEDAAPTTEVFVSGELPKEAKNKIRTLRAGSFLGKLANHLVTSGVFIGGVQSESNQRLQNKIHEVKKEYGVLETPTSEEIDELLGAFDSSYERQAN